MGPPVPARTGRDDADLERAVLEAIGHPRYAGSFLPVWRIIDAIARPEKPAAVRWALQRLEAEGLAEHRRTARGRIEWRAARDPGR